MPDQITVPKSTAEADPRRWIALAVLLLATFMNLLDLTIVNVAIPSLQSGLHSNPSEIEWVVAGYALAFALGLLPFGRLGDIIGRKRLFIVGVVVFTVASAACGLAPSIEWLIAARVLEGIGGGIMTPQVLALMQVMFPPQEKGLAFSIFGLVSGLASVTGPIVGGVLISTNLFGLDWRPIFLVNVPFGLLAIVAGLFLIPITKGNRSLKNDFGGIAIFGVAILALVFPLVQGQTMGWPVWFFALMAGGVVLIAVFYLFERARERRGRAVLLSPLLLHEPNFLLGAVLTLLFFSAVPGLFMLMALFFQEGFGFTPLQSGLTTVPWPIGVAIASAAGGRLGGRFLRFRLLAGIVLLIIGLSVLRVVMTGVTNTIDTWSFVPPLVTGGLGLGLLISALFQITLAMVPPEEAGAGSGALQTFQQVGGAMGIALLGQIFFAAVAADLAAGTDPHVAYVTAIGDALYYDIGAFILMAFLAPFLRAAAKDETPAASSRPARPSRAISRPKVMLPAGRPLAARNKAGSVHTRQ
ncbi:MAG: transporter [Devosia sp.]|uniref:MFS transporter n=1 Tax=Devosia sp. TaxID=1871048 RepID=UPI00262C57AC|nr:MFS transporter [Devosia sp.]MDB5538966.1 transporter [Devosia sp.]